MRALILWLAVALVVVGLAWWRGRRAARKAEALRASREAIAEATLAMAKADAQRKVIEDRTRDVAQREARRVQDEEAARVRAIRAARLAREATERENGEIAARVVPNAAEESAAAAAEAARRLASNAEAEKAAREAAEQARRKAQDHFARKAAEHAEREAQEKARQAADAARFEAEIAARCEAALQAKREAEERARLEAQEQARRDAEARARFAAQEQARIEAEAQARREAEEQARAAAEEAARLEAVAATRRAAESAQRDTEGFEAEPAPAKTPAETLILVADDSKVVRIKATKLLTQHGYRVATAVDGLDAIRQVDDQMPDLIVTDVEMPNLDGFGLARHLKGQARTAHVPIVMITSADDAHREIAHGVGVGLVLGKPFPEEPLLQHIRSFRFPACLPASARPDWASTGAGALVD